jgi:hypothetical protein
MPHWNPKPRSREHRSSLEALHASCPARNSAGAPDGDRSKVVRQFLSSVNITSWQFMVDDGLYFIHLSTRYIYIYWTTSIIWLTNL